MFALHVCKLLLCRYIAPARVYGLTTQQFLQFMRTRSFAKQSHRERDVEDTTHTALTARAHGSWPRCSLHTTAAGLSTSQGPERATQRDCRPRVAASAPRRQVLRPQRGSLTIVRPPSPPRALRRRPTPVQTDCRPIPRLQTELVTSRHLHFEQVGAARLQRARPASRRRG